MLKKFPSLLVMNAISAALLHICLVMAMNGAADGEAVQRSVWSDIPGIAPGAVLICFAVLGLGMIRNNRLIPGAIFWTALSGCALIGALFASVASLAALAANPHEMYRDVASGRLHVAELLRVFYAGFSMTFMDAICLVFLLLTAFYWRERRKTATK